MTAANKSTRRQSLRSIDGCELTGLLSGVNYRNSTTNEAQSQQPEPYIRAAIDANCSGHAVKGTLRGLWGAVRPPRDAEALERYQRALKASQHQQPLTLDEMIARFAMHGIELVEVPRGCSE